jgi:hypothetical protein
MMPVHESFAALFVSVANQIRVYGSRRRSVNESTPTVGDMGKQEVPFVVKMVEESTN